MTTCSDSFWFWFMRPIAESLGAIALVAIVMLVFVCLLGVHVWWIGKRSNQ